MTIMITEIVLWKMPDGISREEIMNKFRATGEAAVERDQKLDYLHRGQGA
jgi:hypothetical protein